MGKRRKEANSDSELDSKGIPLQPQAIEKWEFIDLRELGSGQLYVSAYKAPDHHTVYMFVANEPINDIDIRDYVPPNAVEIGKIEF